MHFHEKKTLIEILHWFCYSSTIAWTEMSLNKGPLLSLFMIHSVEIWEFFYHSDLQKKNDRKILEYPQCG